MRSLKEFMLFLEREEPHEVFSFEELRKYVGSTQRHEYLQKTLGEAQYGSSRAVYNLSENSVLKAALNDKGEVQNKTEYDLFHSAPPAVKEVLAAIQEPHDEEFQWIVMERVKPLSDEASFEQALGLTSEMASELFSGFCFYSKNVEDLKANIQKSIDYFTELPSNKPRRWDKTPRVDPRIAKYKQALHFTDDFARLCLAVPHLESNGGDLGRLDQLGLTRDGRLVILDYGFGENTFKMYNPSVYQQADAQRRQEMDLDYYEYDGGEQYDKYGNKLAKPKPRINTMPAKKPIADDEYIPF